MFDPRAACCFSGYRPEKFHNSGISPEEGYDRMYTLLERAIHDAADAGCTCFLTGMSRGFDLWAAEAVLRARQKRPLKLFCCLPYERQSADWEPVWRALHTRVLLAADHTYCLSPSYYPGCYHERNRFMVDAASRLICWYDGAPGGTAYTLDYARKKGLTIVNLADRQLSLF